MRSVNQMVFGNRHAADQFLTLLDRRCWVRCELGRDADRGNDDDDDDEDNDEDDDEDDDDDEDEEWDPIVARNRMRRARGARPSFNQRRTTHCSTPSSASPPPPPPTCHSSVVLPWLRR